MTAPAQAFVGSTGNNKYLQPIYLALKDSGQNALGITWYDENVDFYTPTTKQMIEDILNYTPTP